MLIFVIVYCLILLLSSCQESQVVQPITDSEPVNQVTLDELQGVWKASTDVYMLRFNEDGTYQRATSTAQLDTVPHGHGTYNLGGNKLTLTPADNSYECAGEVGVYSLAVLPSGEIRINIIEDNCRMRSKNLVTPYKRFQ